MRLYKAIILGGSGNTHVATLFVYADNEIRVDRLYVRTHPDYKPGMNISITEVEKPGIISYQRG